jgi:hypothetical protein
MPSLSRAMVSPVGLPVSSLTIFTSTSGLILIDWREVAVKNLLSLPATTQLKPGWASPQRWATVVVGRSQPPTRTIINEYSSLARMAVDLTIGSYSSEFRLPRGAMRVERGNREDSGARDSSIAGSAQCRGEKLDNMI